VIAGVADTHTALWYLLKNPRLSAVARAFMDDAARAGDDIALSPISLADTPIRRQLEPPALSRASSVRRSSSPSGTWRASAAL